ncbi:MAG: CoA transferase [Pseudomonadota bacterium]
MSSVQPDILDGYRILDFTRALAGPTCTRMFAELGAEVIKVESAPAGDMTRAISKFNGSDRSLYFVQQNLNKRSLCLNLRDPRALELLKEIIATCDVVVENFKPGVLAEMGLGYEVLQSIKPDIILCSISALGQSGPLSTKPGYDYIAQAYSGVTSMIGDEHEAPYLPLVGVGDVSTGVTAAFSICAALLKRDKTGEGQHIDVALLDVYYHYHEANIHQYSATNGELNPTRKGRHVSYVCPAGIFNGTDGYLLVMGFLHHWPDLCKAMGREDLITDPDFENDGVRLQRVDEVIAVIEAWLKTFPDVDSAIAKLEASGVPCAPILSVEDTTQHPHHLARQTVRTVNDPIYGEFQMPGMPARFIGKEPHPGYVAPTLGEHNAAVLKEVLGKSDADIEALAEDGVLHAEER